ncbi:MAG TPA: hypothetical protein VJ890_29210 [Vineibacter sp.]|nr:hypothetical protein [Vineibacter sp.]
MSTPPSLSLRPATIFRVVASLDIALGLAAALFGSSLASLPDIVPGLSAWWLVGGVLALGGVAMLVFAASLDRKRPSASPAGDDPVRRE